MLGRLGNPSPRVQGSLTAGCLRPRAGPAPLDKTERRDRGLDSIARDNPADSLMPQGQWCSPYPHSTGPGSTGKGSRTHAGRTPDSVWAGSTMLDTIHPAGCPLKINFYEIFIMGPHFGDHA